MCLLLLISLKPTGKNDPITCLATAAPLLEPLGFAAASAGVGGGATADPKRKRAAVDTHLLVCKEYA